MSQHFVTSGDDLVSLLQAAGDLDVRGAANSGSHWYEDGVLFVLENEDALQFFFGSPCPAVGLALACTTLPSSSSSGLSSPRWRMVSAWIGMARAPLRVAVVMRAVADRPGSRVGGGFCSVTTTLKSFASWLLEVVCAVETPVERSTALLPISRHHAFELLLGNGVDGDFRRLPDLHVHDVASRPP